MRIALIIAFMCSGLLASAQSRMTPETLWKLGRVSAIGITKDNRNVVYRVSTPSVSDNKSSSKMFVIPLQGGTPKEVTDGASLVANNRLSPDGKYMISAREVKMRNVYGKDFYPELTKSNVQIYDQLNYRHWDTWEDGAFSHIFLQPMVNGKAAEGKDIMNGLPYDSPQKPFGGDEDFIFSADSKDVLYVTKPKTGADYAQSTNTDIFRYEIASGKTTNLTEGMMGYDLAPAYSVNGTLAWLSMRRDGYEADKNDLIVSRGNNRVNLTKDWDGTVLGFQWSNDGSRLFFYAPIDGTEQLFVVNDVAGSKTKPTVKQITRGQFDINGIAGQAGNTLVVSRTDMNTAAELYTVDLSNGSMKQLTNVNKDIYSSIQKSNVEKRTVKTTDGKEMLVWVIYPPGFNKSKKYPTLLYCQGGPQSPLSQSYSYRWNFQLMAANGYIIVAPNRRGMPGHGVKWNEDISKDWGGQVMDDYLSAIDDVSKEAYVDTKRLGAVGASYGGYSVYYLAGLKPDKFKTLIAHDGVFDLRSMSGTTEELWFTNWDFGGNYWDKKNDAAQKTFSKFNPIELAGNWKTPILIIQGGIDFRVPVEQGLQAFQAAQLKGIKSKLLYLPEENHWVLKPQNALVWQNEFFKWLQETL
jgi:dipeptidyl aminopeptidase/acylaminoacyl peptidase